MLATLPGAAPSPAASARRHALVEITQTLAIAAQTDPELPYWVADDYLRAVALVLLDWAWCQIGAASHGERWNAPAQALTQWVLPEFDMRAAILRPQLKLLGERVSAARWAAARSSAAYSLEINFSTGIWLNAGSAKNFARSSNANFLASVSTCRYSALPKPMDRIS